ANGEIDPQLITQGLLTAALINGGEDNVSVMAVKRKINQPRVQPLTVQQPTVEEIIPVIQKQLHPAPLSAPVRPQPNQPNSFYSTPTQEQQLPLTNKEKIEAINPNAPDPLFAVRNFIIATYPPDKALQYNGGID